MTAEEIMEIINNYRYELECIMDSFDSPYYIEYGKAVMKHNGIAELLRRINKAESEKKSSEGF